MSFFLNKTSAKRRVTLIASISSLLLSLDHGQLIPEIEATYSSTPKPFSLNVNPAFIETTRLKVQLGRIANDLGVAPFSEGVPTETAAALQTPSLPGFGFTPAPLHAGLGPIEADHAFDALMHQLSYPRYVIQGGDLGSFILRYQAVLHPESVISVLSNLWAPVITATDLARFDAKETTGGETDYFRNATGFQTGGAGYLFLQSTQPLMLGHAMTDSPLGFMLYIYQLMQELGTFYHWSLDELITWAMMYVIQGPYPAMRMYKEFHRANQFSGIDNFGPGLFVNVPVGVTQRPQDVGWGVPLDLARTLGNVSAIYVHNYGGHFAAYQTPESLLDDCWRFWGNESASGVGKKSHY
ncbi:hypothetical protein ACHAQJ_000054 [Trichoderma viride]